MTVPLRLHKSENQCNWDIFKATHICIQCPYQALDWDTTVQFGAFIPSARSVQLRPPISTSSQDLAHDCTYHIQIKTASLHLRDSRENQPNTYRHTTAIQRSIRPLRSQKRPLQAWTIILCWALLLGVTTAEKLLTESYSKLNPRSVDPLGIFSTTTKIQTMAKEGIFRTLSSYGVILIPHSKAKAFERDRTFHTNPNVQTVCPGSTSQHLSRWILVRFSDRRLWVTLERHMKSKPSRLANRWTGHWQISTMNVDTLSAIIYTAKGMSQALDSSQDGRATKQPTTRSEHLPA